MARFVAETLLERGIEPVFAYYLPYSINRSLSVPTHRLFTKRVDKQTTTFCGYDSHGIGAWLPEFEFTHYWPTAAWRELIGQHELCLAVSGNCLAATPFALCNKPFWAWIATGWAEDRLQRVSRFPPFRKLLDRSITTPGALRLERRILQSAGSIVALSEHTRETLNNIGAFQGVRHVLPMGIDTRKFKRRHNGGERSPTVGFVGRLDDPRKNVELLLQALALCRKQITNIKAVLIGDDGKGQTHEAVRRYDLESVVTVVDYVDNNQMADFLNQLDVFIIPSHQEGLCIAALEAMSCGVPVVSTRCGGPEEFVIDRETGFLVDSTPTDLAGRIVELISSPLTRKLYSGNAVRLIEQRYSLDRAKEVFWSTLTSTFDETRLDLAASHAGGI